MRIALVECPPFNPGAMMRGHLRFTAMLALCVACGSGSTGPTSDGNASRLHFMRTVLAGTEGPRLWAATPGDLTGSWSGHVIPDTASALRVSPDGRRLVYSDGRWIHLLDLASGHRVQLSPAWAEDRWPSWNGSSTRILVTRTTGSGGSARLVSLGIAPGDSIAHGVLDAPVNAEPSWSPDGQWVARTRWPYGLPLEVMALDGSGLVELAPGVAGARFRSPVWSPEGGRVVASEQQAWDGSGRVAVWSIGGDELASVTLSSAPSLLAWDPAGERIAMCAYAGIHLSAPRYEVSIWDLRTGAREVITPTSASDCLVTWGRR